MLHLTTASKERHKAWCIIKVLSRCLKMQHFTCHRKLIKRRKLPILKHVAKPSDEAGLCGHLLESWQMLLPTNVKTRPITI